MCKTGDFDGNKIEHVLLELKSLFCLLIPVCVLLLWRIPGPKATWRGSNSFISDYSPCSSEVSRSHPSPLPLFLSPSFYSLCRSAGLKLALRPMLALNLWQFSCLGWVLDAIIASPISLNPVFFSISFITSHGSMSYLPIMCLHSRRIYQPLEGSV